MNAATNEGRQMQLPGLPVPPAEPFHTDNPREIRIICALACAPRTREQLDNIAGASNVPDAIAALHRCRLAAHPRYLGGVT